MRLVLTAAAQFDLVTGFHLGGAKRLPVHQLHERSQNQIGADDKSAGQRAGKQQPAARESPDHRRAPQRRSGVEPAHIEALA
jgi:hypothetical protein